jgi:hypothetical protein
MTPRPTTRHRIAAFASALLMSVLLSTAAQGRTGDEHSDSQADTPADTQAEIERVMEISCRDERGRPQSWLDRTHSYVVQRMCEPAAWFDGFFGDVRSDEETPVGSFVRVRNSVIWDETEGFDNDLEVSANLTLPRVSERIRLLISRGTADPDDPESDRSLPDEGEESRLGLRVLLAGWGQTQFDLDGTVGLSVGGLNPRGRARLRHTRGLTDSTQARFTQTAFWESDEGLGTTARADWEWLPDAETLVRLTARGTYSEETDGVEWHTGLVSYRQLDRDTAIRSELGAYGYTSPHVETKEMFVNVRFRRSFLRDWLFYELQPEYAWPLEGRDGPRRSDWRFYLTLEVQFENAGHRRLRIEEEEGVEAAGDEPPLEHYRGP